MPRRLAVVLVALFVLSCQNKPEAPPVPPKPKVLFLGLDGATWTVMGPMIERGELPTFRKVMEQGASMPRFETISSTLSPVVWTSVATGRTPEDHGVTSFTTDLPNGQRIPVTSSQRKARAIWEVATRRGVSVGVTGWWASWPAEDVNGYDITDHANPAFSELLIQDKTYWTADAKDLALLKRDFYPLEIGPVLARHWMTREQFPFDDLQRRGGFTQAQMDVLRAAPWNDRAVYPWLKTFYRIDYPLFRVGMDLMKERPTDLWMLYLRGSDAVQHYGWDLVEPERFAKPINNVARDRGLVQGVYRYLDTFLAEILKAQPEGSWLIIASDHGAEASPEAQNPAALKRPGEHSQTAKGILFISGPGVKKGYQIQKGSPYDLMPTMAWLLGLPLSQELAGHPLTEAFEENFVRSLPMQTVPSYGERKMGPLLASPSDEEMIKSLKNLGYIQ
jgi:predicted AlkP superfamily pyrophosphatase or phosphodiesterase